LDITSKEVFKIKKKYLIMFSALFVFGLLALSGCSLIDQDSVGRKLSSNTGVQQAQVGGNQVGGNQALETNELSKIVIGDEVIPVSKQRCATFSCNADGNVICCKDGSPTARLCCSDVDGDGDGDGGLYTPG